MQKVDRSEPDQPVSESAIRIFYAYLDSYTFNKNVLPLNSSESCYFIDEHMPGCYFGWVESELQESCLYSSLKNTKIGVPQGGALSGLIANILLDQVDKKLVRKNDKELTYVRYCDDMIILHPRKHKCREYLDIYQSELRKMKLISHIPQNIVKYDRNFWKVKSKECYKWGPKGMVPWVGFVGYEINVNGDVRVRKSSLQKEMQKQYKTVQEVLRAINDTPRLSPKTIEESITNRLIQMSVGRVRLHNYQDADNEMCWANGFKLITDNKYSRIQMKRLDACRNALLRKLKKRLRLFDEQEADSGSRKRELIYYGKPFSYYYHVVEKLKSE